MPNSHEGVLKKSVRFGELAPGTALLTTNRQVLNEKRETRNEKQTLNTNQIISRNRIKTKEKIHIYRNILLQNAKTDATHTRNESCKERLYASPCEIDDGYRNELDIDHEYDTLKPRAGSVVSTEDQNMSVKELVNKYNAFSQTESPKYGHLRAGNDYESPTSYQPSSYLHYKPKRNDDVQKIPIRRGIALPFSTELKTDMSSTSTAFEAQLNEFDRDLWYSRIQRRRERQIKKKARQRTWKGFRKKLSCFPICPIGEEILLKIAPKESRNEFQEILTKSLVGTYTPNNNGIFNSMWNSNIFGTSNPVVVPKKSGNILATSPYDRFCSEEERDVLDRMGASVNASDALLDALSPCDTLREAKSRKTFYDNINVKEKERQFQNDGKSRNSSMRLFNNMTESFRVSLSPYERYRIMQKLNKCPMSFETFLKRTYPIPTQCSKKVHRRSRDVPAGLWV